MPDDFSRKQNTDLIRLSNFILLSVIIIANILLCNPVEGQQKLAQYTYLVKFADKNHNSYHLSQPNQFLSQRALLHRNNQSIEINETDLPVSEAYIDSLKESGIFVLNKSKWLNAVSVRITDTVLYSKLATFSFVKHSPVQKSIQKNYITKRNFEENLNTISTNAADDYGSSFNQIDLHHGEFLHELGFRGNEMLIAVIDAGFENAYTMSALDSLWIDNRVLLTRDFVNPGGDVFIQHYHGSHVLSILASTSHGNLIGSAPKATYILLRSEDATLEPRAIDGQPIEREYPVEEFNWACAAELADSIGADIISSSLGYTTFNDSTLNHTYQDMNGKKSMASIAAEIASSKGMVVVVSAGNSGNDPWHYISSPADADSILTIGAVDKDGNSVGFSSKGPTSDGRIKPDVVAKGAGTTLQQTNNIFASGNGTSYAAPIIAGLAACLWQSCPQKKRKEIIETIKKYASNEAKPDNNVGYGIPDFRKIFYALHTENYRYTSQITCFPDPFSSSFTMKFDPIPEGFIYLDIYKTTGQLLLTKKINVDKNLPNYIELNELSGFLRGVYILQIRSTSKSMTTRILKI